MRFRTQRAALAGFEIHDILPKAAALECQRLILRFRQKRKINPEGTVDAFRAADGLKDQINRRTQIHGAHGGGDMRQHAALRRNIVSQPQPVQHVQDAEHRFHIIGRGIDANHRITGAKQKPIQGGGCDAARVIRWVIGLQANGKAALQADGVAKPRDIDAFRRNRDQIRRAHDLGGRGHHFRRQAWRKRRKGCAIGGIGKQPIAKAANGQAADRGEGRLVMAVLDQPRDLICLIRNDAFRKEMGQR